MIYIHSANRKKRFRQLLLVLIPFVILFAIFLNYQTNRTILQTMATQSLVHTNFIKGIDSQNLTTQDRQEIQDKYPNFAQIAIMDKDLTRNYGDNFKDKNVLKSISQNLSNDSKSEEYGIEPTGYWIANRIEDSQSGPWLIEFYPLEVYASIKTNAILIWSVVVIMIVIILYFAYKIILMYISSPIKVIDEGIQRVLEDDFTFEYVGSQFQEIDQLGRTVTSLKDKLKNSRKELIASEQRLSLLLDHLILGVVLIGADHKIKLFNPEAKSLLQFGDETIGRSYEANVQSFVLIDMISQVLRDFEAKSAEIELFIPKQKVIDVNIIPYKDEMTDGKRGEAILLLLYDMSHIRRLEKIRSDFVANASHELRTPVTAIRGFAETLQDGAMEDPELSAKFINIIANESIRLEKLIHDILDLSRIEQRSEPLHQVSFDLVQVVQELVDFLAVKAKTKNILVSTHFSEDVIMMTTDAGRVKQIIINLLDNAITYSEPGKPVNIIVEADDVYVTIIIEDKGIGIPQADLKRIFERFYRVDKGRSRNSGGTGLGLSIVNNLVTLLNGTISVESEVNKGTKFTVKLPLDEAINI